MSDLGPGEGGWPFVHFGLIVTGEGEEQFLPDFLRALAGTGCRHFKVLRRIGQRKPLSSEKRMLSMVGSGKKIPNRDQDEIGLPARRFLQERTSNHVLLIDDLEHDQGESVAAIRAKFTRYRQALDTILNDRTLSRRVAVHFLINMVEAYYFADTQTLNGVLGTSLGDHPEDVEKIRHPKNDLKRESPGFDEKQHGAQVAKVLDLEHVLSRPDTCGGLRSLVAWCSQKIRQTESERFCLTTGIHLWVTGQQLNPP